MTSSKASPVVLITGCSSGIGRHLALEFAAKGCTVLATARSTKSLDQLTQDHERIKALALDLDNAKSPEALRDAVVEITGGHLDVLVNNAGTHYAATALDMNVDEAARLFNVNLFTVMRMCQLFVPMLRKAARGRIVQIGSVTRQVPVVWQCAYNASKAALSQYSKTLRLEVEPLGIEVIEIVTGYVQSNILHHGMYAPTDSLYLPIKETVQSVKSQGNKNGMPGHAYAQSVVGKVLRTGTQPEIWEGKLAWLLRLLVTWFPLRFINWVVSRQFRLSLLYSKTGSSN